MKEFIGAFEKQLRNASSRVCLSVCLSVCRSSHWQDFREVFAFGMLTKFAPLGQFLKLRQDPHPPPQLPLRQRTQP